MKKLLNIVFVVFLLMGCSKAGTSYSDVKIYGLASPIQLTGDTTRIIMSDYFISPVVVDSIVSDDESLQVSYVDDFIFLVTDENSKPISNLTLYAEGIPYSFLVKGNQEKNATLVVTINASKTVSDFRIKGEFNDWTLDSGNFKFGPSNYKWIYQFRAKPGTYQYKLVADGNEIDDPSNPHKISNGMGGFNNILEIPGPEKNEFPSISTESFTETEIIISSEKTDNIYAYWNNFRIEVKQEKNKFKITIPSFAKYESRSHIRVFGYNKVAASNDLLVPLAKGKVITDPSKLNNNDWQSSIMYFMMVDRFVNGDSTNDESVQDPSVLPEANYYGGDIAGITKKINDGYFKKLGINTIWISPITQNPTNAWGQFKDPDTKFSGYHGYWPITSTTVDYRLGSPKDVREMLSTAHKNGLSVLLDYVANHVHQQHSVYQKNKDWVTPLYLPDGTLNTENWDSHRLTTWFDTFLPTLNLMDQQITDFMVDSALFWVTEYDFDGFRHDATKHIPNNFWRTLNKKVKVVSQEKGKHIYQLGETYGVPSLINSYIGSGLLDAQFDFNMYDAALPTFASDSTSFFSLTETIKTSLNTYGYHHLMGNIAGNQDKPRFISYADGTLDLNSYGNEQKRFGWKNDIQVIDTLGYKRLAMFNAFNMIIPGVPIIYYGDEIGMPGAGDPDNRRMMKFKNLNKYEASLQAEISNQVQTRNTNMALLYGDFNIIECSDYKLIISRKYFDNHILITFDKSKWTYSIENK